MLPPDLPTVSVEAGSTFGWSTYADAAIGLDHFGVSAPGPVAFEHLGFTPERVAEVAAALVGSEPGPWRADH